MTVPETTPEPAEPGFLRDRMAAGRSCVCPHPTDEHSLYGCTHGCACEWLPKPAPADVGLRDRVATALGTIAVVGGCPPQMVVPVLDGSNPRLARIADWQPLDRVIDAVLAVLPAPADGAAVLLWAAGAIVAETRLAKERQILEPDKFRPCRDASAQLRRLADEAQQPEAEAHRTRTEWIAEVLEDDGMWMYLGTGPDRSVAERRRASVTRRHPGAETRTVRKTTTYTVAADRGTAAAIDETAATIQAEGAQR